ncbi:site-specific integrase [Ruegeria sp. AU67]|uniref:site-specific integrase n=1 Tax=Ruegeria sp. AU67 TaxID=2108530 RepID=UPI0013583AED|nr:site-specific integrase [Ruegeria sp. AU67]
MKWARSAELRAERGVLTQSNRGMSAKLTIGFALSKYRDTAAPTHRSGDREQRCIDAMFKHHERFTRLWLDTLTVAEVSEWRDERLQKVSASPVVSELTVLQGAVGRAPDAGAVNVVQQVKRPRVDDRQERRLQAGELQNLLQACDQDRNKLLRPLLVLAVETAMRRGELLAMQWRHVDLLRCTVLLPKTKPNSNWLQ